MTNSVVLNNVDHKDLRIITTRGVSFGDNVMSAFTFPQEFRNLQAHYPIFFYKTEDGTHFQSAALLGLQEGENLFLGTDGWDADYVPLALQHKPFLIGRSNGEMVMHVDLDSPRISRTEGEPVFLAHGGTTEFLERMSSILGTIHEGVEKAPKFSAALMEHELLESFVFDVELEDGSESRLSGFYTINEERLANLSGNALDQLHKAGYLESIFMAIASLSNLSALGRRKNRSHAGHS